MKKQSPPKVFGLFPANGTTSTAPQGPPHEAHHGAARLHALLSIHKTMGLGNHTETPFFPTLYETFVWHFISNNLLNHISSFS